MPANPSVRSDAPEKFPLFALLTALACLAGAAALAYAPVRKQLSGIEHWTADWRTTLLADRVTGTHDKIAVVLFNSDTFGGETKTPIPRDVHAQVLRTLAGMEPLAIATDFYFVASQGAEKDKAILDAIHEIKVPVVLGAVDGRTKEFSEGQLAYQDKFLAEAAKPAGYLSLKYDSGAVVRSTSPPKAGSPYKESFARATANAAGYSTENARRTERIAWLAGDDPAVQPFLTIPAQDVLAAAGDEAKRAALSEKVRGRVAITGIDMPNQDRHDTTLSVQTEERMLGVMIHAHMLAQLMDGRHFSEMTGGRKLALLLAVGAAGFGLSWYFWRRQLDFLSLSIATGVLIAIDAATYAYLRTLLPFTLTLTVWFLAVTAGHNVRALVEWWRTKRRLQSGAVATAA